jgi:RNA polymerase sigma-70 factor (TIGR02943 family)
MSDNKVFKLWVDDYSDMLYRYSLRRLGDEELCKDLVQETFLAAWRNFANYKGEASVKNWLFTILRSRIADHFRSSHTRLVVNDIRTGHNDHTFFDEQEHWKDGMYPKEWMVNHSTEVEAKEFHRQFRSCTGKLKQVQSAVFVMKYVDGMESDEICKELEISPSNYWVLIHRAKVQLRACLEKNWINT